MFLHACVCVCVNLYVCACVYVCECVCVGRRDVWDQHFNGNCRPRDWGQGMSETNIFGGDCRSHGWGLGTPEANIVGGDCRHLCWKLSVSRLGKRNTWDQICIHTYPNTSRYHNTKIDHNTHTTTIYSSSGHRCSCDPFFHGAENPFHPLPSPPNLLITRRVVL